MFGRRAVAKDGLAYWCKDCFGAHSRRRRAENPERVRASYAKWRTENPEKSRAASDRWKAEHPERNRATHAQWNADHPARTLAYCQKRRAQKANACIEPIPDDIKAQLIELYGPTCMKPGCENTNLEVDHVVPLNDEGAHAVSNFQLLCKSCNCSKGDRSHADYRPQLVKV